MNHYTSYISSLLDFQTIGSRKIERSDIYEKMDELCQLRKWSVLMKAPNCYTEQLMYYYEAYAGCDMKYLMEILFQLLNIGSRF